jgi:hypothetical protein
LGKCDDKSQGPGFFLHPHSRHLNGRATAAVKKEKEGRGLRWLLSDTQEVGSLAPVDGDGSMMCSEGEIGAGAKSRGKQDDSVCRKNTHGKTMDGGE